jgi:Ca2+-binding RTX toxin-like protein
VVTGNVAAVTVNLSNQAGEAFTVNLSNQGDTVTTADGADSVIGGSGVDNISAGSGNDTIVGAQNDALLDGGADTTDDWLQIGANFNDSGDAQIANIEKVDVTADGLTVNLGDQTEGFDVTGFAGGATTFVGGSGEDSFTGGTGDDSISAGADADSIVGGSGNDTIVGAQDDALLDGGTDTTGDWLQVGANFTSTGDSQIANIEKVDLTVTGLTVNFTNQSEHLAIYGFASGASVITSGSGNDSLFGGSGADTLTGGSGNDTLKGWIGSATANSTNIAGSSDTLTGGAGADVFVLGDATDVAYGGSSDATLYTKAQINGFDFTQDKFLLHAYGGASAGTFSKNTAANEAYFAKSGGGVVNAYNVLYNDAAGTGQIFVDGTTRLVAEFTFTAGQGDNISANNFLFA